MILQTVFNHLRKILKYKDQNDSFEAKFIDMEEFNTEEKEEREAYGFCTGFSALFVMAHLTDNLTEFHARNAILSKLNLSELELLAHNPETALNELLDFLSPSGLEYKEILAFMDSLELLQFPYLYRNLFHHRLLISQLKLPETLSYASSKKMEEMGGLVEIYSQSIVPTVSEFTEYFTELQTHINNASVEKKMGIILCTYDHTVAITCVSSKWCFIDVNDNGRTYFVNSKNLAKLIIDKEPFLPLNLFIFSAKKYENLPELIKFKEDLKSFKKQYLITPLIIHRTVDENVGLAQMSADGNNFEMIPLLLENGYDLNALSMAGTLVHIAAQAENIRFLEELAKYPHVDFNQVNKQKETPAIWAAKNQSSQKVILALDKSKSIDFNISDINGNTPLHFAVANKNYNLVKSLADCNHHVNLASKNNKGKTPLDIAILTGDKKIICQLLTWNAEKKYSLQDVMGLEGVPMLKEFEEFYPTLKFGQNSYPEKYNFFSTKRENYRTCSINTPIGKPIKTCLEKRSIEKVLGGNQNTRLNLKNKIYEEGDIKKNEEGEPSISKFRKFS